MHISNQYKYSDEIKQQAQDLFAQGCRIKEVAEKLGIPFATVGTWRTKSKNLDNIKRQVMFRNETKPEFAFIKEILEFTQTNPDLSIATIADLFEVSYQSLYRWVK